MAMNASTGTLTSSWRKELIPSTLSRTKMDLVITTSAGQEKMNSNSRGHLQRDAHSHMLYDRNPDGDEMPWCFFRRGRRLLWNYCDVTECPDPTGRL